MTPISHLSPDLLACIAIAAMAVGFVCAILALAAYGSYCVARHEAHEQSESAAHYRRLYAGQREITESKEAHICTLRADLLASNQSFNRLLAMRRAVGSSPLNQ